MKVYKYLSTNPTPNLTNNHTPEFPGAIHTTLFYITLLFNNISLDINHIYDVVMIFVVVFGVSSVST
jgi:hypothetical protein